jgi:hypothetical protein
MQQLTYEDVLAKVDREKAARAVASCLVYLGGLEDWGSDEFCAVQETLFAAKPADLPTVGDQDDDALEFWGTISSSLGNETDYEPDEDDDEV